jgi:voltage-gated potassium channel
MLNLTRGFHPNRRVNIVARLLGTTVIVLGVLSLGIGLLRLFFSGAQHQELIKSLSKGAENVETQLEFLRFGSIISIASGIFLIILGRSLNKGSRRAWWVSVVITGILSLSFLTLRAKLDLPGGSLLPGVRSLMGVIALLILVGLIAMRRYFTARLRWNLTTTQVVALVAIVFASAYGILGTYALRDEFNKPDMKWHDAIYFTVVTYTTLGYGDITPAGERAKWFTMSLVVVGISSFVTAGAALFDPFIQNRMMGVLSIMGRTESNKLKDHTIVCGYNNVGKNVVSQLLTNEKPFIVLEQDPFLSESASQQNIPVISGDPTLEESLLSAQIAKAESVIACLDDDAHNTMVALIANDLKRQGKCRAELRIIARSENESAVSRMKAAGADYVLSPSSVAGKAMAELSMETDEQKRTQISSFWE